MKILKNEVYLFYGLLLIHALYVYLLPVFVTQDGPSHLYNSVILKDLIFKANDSFYLDYFNKNWQLFPNWFSSVVMVGLLTVFPAVIAEKVFVSLAMVLLPLTLRLVIKTINEEALFLSSFGLVFANSYFLLYGFYNFQWSIIFFCLFVVWYIKFHNHGGIKQGIILSLFGVLIAFTHPVITVHISVLVGVSILFQFVDLLQNKGELKEKLWKRIFSLILIMLPAFIIFVVFFVGAEQKEINLFETRLNFSQLLRLLVPKNFAVFHNSELIFLSVFTLILFTVFGYMVYRYKTFKTNKFIQVLMGLLTFHFFVYFFLNDKLAGGSYLITRTQLLIYLVLLLVISCYSFSTKYRAIFTTVSSIVPLMILFLRIPAHGKISTITKEYINTLEVVPDGSTLLPLSFSNSGEIDSKVLSKKLYIFKHISGYIASKKNIVSFDNYEANTDYFPIKWIEKKNPYQHLSWGNLAGLENNPPSVNIRAYNNIEGCSVDYISLFGDDSRFQDTSEALKDLYIQLNNEYEFLVRSEDGLTRVYKKK